jgi:uncharacterized protein YdaU (DUF1376 family)
MTKLEPLPWFAFNIADYLKDTMRLSTEAHGAYLLLMLDYYGTGAPCPDDDYVLSAVAKLPEERWKQVRKALQPLFDVRDGHWFHSRIEREMRDASDRHAKRTAAASAANDARWGGKGAKADQSTAPRSPDTARAPKNANRTPNRMRDAIPIASVPVSPEDPQIQIHSTLTVEREGALSEVDDDDLEIGTSIPKDFLPSAETSDRARAAGMEVAEIDAEVRKFINHQLSAGNFSSNWQASFANWIERGIEYRAKQTAKAPPRIEVNNAPYVPTERDWDDACMRYARNNSIWSKHLGPDPGLPSCRAPIAILLKHGLRKAAS